MNAQNKARILKRFFGSRAFQRINLAAGFLLILTLLSGCLLIPNQGQVSTQVAQTLASIQTESAAPTLFQPSTPVTPSLTPTLSPSPTTTPTGTSTLLTAPCNRASFIGDVTIPNGTSISAGSSFTKTWRLQNLGSCTWTTSYALVFSAGDRMGGPTAASLPFNVIPGATIDLSVQLTAPAAAGTYQGQWKLRDANGNLFGVGVDGNQPLGVKIVVSTPAIFAVTRVDTTVSITHYTGICPVNVTFNANIITNGAGKVTYYWVRSDGSKSAEQTLTYTAAGSQKVTDTWSYGKPGAKVNGWENLYINAPNHQNFSQVTFSLSCNPTTATPTVTRTKAPTGTRTPTPTKTAISTPTSTRTSTGIDTSTVTQTVPPTLTPTETSTTAPLFTATSTETVSPSETPAPTQTPPEEPTSTLSATETATETEAVPPLPTSTPTLEPCNSYPDDGIPPSQDSWVDQADPETSHGTDTQFHIRSTGNDLQWALVQFDLSSIPAGSEITSAIFYINDETGGDKTIDFRPVTAPWDETVTWNTQPTLDTTPVGGFTLTKDPCVRAGYIDPALVQSWLDSPSTNYGLALYPPSGVGDVSLTSREGSKPPLLVISFNPSAAASSLANPQLQSAPLSTTPEPAAPAAGAASKRLSGGALTGVFVALFVVALAAFVVWRSRSKKAK